MNEDWEVGEVYIIYYEDTEKPPLVIIGEDVALKTFDKVKDNWNCHLFQRIKDATGLREGGKE